MDCRGASSPTVHASFFALFPQDMSEYKRRGTEAQSEYVISI